MSSAPRSGPRADPALPPVSGLARDVVRAALLTLLLVGVVMPCFGQVDPYWLASWKDAQRTLPDPVPTEGRIAPEGTPGTPLLIRGRVQNPDGQPAAGVLVHAYHRDDAGFEFGPGDDAYPTWGLQGWALSDGEGRFRFRTIRPAPDNLGREGAHVHFTLVSDTFGRHWAPKIFFADDPMVPPRERQASAAAGALGWVVSPRQEGGVTVVDVTFRLKAEGDF